MPDKPTAPADPSSAPVQDQPTKETFPTREEREELRRIYPCEHSETYEWIHEVCDAIDTLEQRLAAAEEDTEKIAELSTGWKYGNEGAHLLRIHDIAARKEGKP